MGFALRTLALRPVPTWEPERVRAIQRRRLERLVALAVARSPFYRAKYRGIDLTRFRLEDLPPTNKAEMMADLDAVWTDPAVRRADLERFVDEPANEGRWFLDRYAPSHTSGSQGQPLLMLATRRQLDLFFGLQSTRGNAEKVRVRDALWRMIQPRRLAVVTLKKGFYPSASAFEYMPSAVRRYVRLCWLSQSDPDVVERLNAFRPTALTAYASVLDQLAREAKAGRLHLPDLKQVVNNSEMLTEAAYDRVREAFGHHVMNNYATGECPFLTNGCQAGPGAHVNADWAILEVVDKDYRPVPDGTPGAKVLITNLCNEVQPFLRYEIGDVVTMAGDAGPCACGSRLPRVARIDGRTADTFWVRDGSTYREVISSVFKNAFDYTREVREWQAVQVERNRVVLNIELLPGATLDEPHAWWSIRRQLDLYGFTGVLDVALRTVPLLASDPKTGKFRRMVSLVGPPADLPTSPAPRLRIDPPEGSDAAARPTAPARSPAA